MKERQIDSVCSLNVVINFWFYLRQYQAALDVPLESRRNKVLAVPACEQ